MTLKTIQGIGLGAGMLAALAAPAEGQLFGDVSYKVRVEDNVGDEDPERLRFNLGYKGRGWIVGTRHDASFGDFSNGYGADFVRGIVNKKLQLGLLSNKTPGKDADGNPSGQRTEYLSVFTKPAQGLAVAANLTLDGLDHTLLFAEYLRELGPLGIRGTYLDDLGKPRVQNLELELRSPSFLPYDGRVSLMGKLVGTPKGYRGAIEGGLIVPIGGKK